MNEAYVRREIFGLLRRLWYTPHRLKDAVVCPKCGTKILPQTGRPDILANSAYGPGIYVEVKVLDPSRYKSFSFSNISEEQERYLNRRRAEGFKCYLALGTIGVPRGQRELWLIPWSAWRCAQTVFSGKRKSIPHVKIGKWDLSTTWRRYKMLWHDGCWHAPEGHPIWQEGAPEGEKDLGQNTDND